MPSSDPGTIMAGQPTISARIRALAAAGFSRAEIAKLVQRSYQQVRQVLLDEERRRSLEGASDGIRNTGASGMREEPAPFEHLRDPRKPATERLELEKGGRLTLSPSMMEAMGLAPGRVVLAIPDGDGVVKLMTPDTAMKQAQAIIRQYVPPGVSLVDELLAERRREAEREWAESEKAYNGG